MRHTNTSSVSEAPLSRLSNWSIVRGPMITEVTAGWAMGNATASSGSVVPMLSATATSRSTTSSLAPGERGRRVEAVGVQGRATGGQVDRAAPAVSAGQEAGGQRAPPVTVVVRPGSSTHSDETLDRIDAIVPPGTDVYPPDGVWTPPSLTELPLRRRPVGEWSGA